MSLKDVLMVYLIVNDFMVATCALYALFKADALHALFRY